MTVLGKAHNIKYLTCNLPIHFITHTTLEFKKIICIIQAVGLVRPIIAVVSVLRTKIDIYKEI